MRERLQALDAGIVDLLAARFRLVAQLWAHKAAVGIPLEDPGREAETLRRLRVLGQRTGLDPRFVEFLFRSVISEGKRAAGPLTTPRPGRTPRAGPVASPAPGPRVDRSPSATGPGPAPIGPGGALHRSRAHRGGGAPPDRPVPGTTR